MNPDRTPERRLFRTAAIGLLFATGLAACGGGSSNGHGHFVPAPVACDSASVPSADGYAIGMCASTKTGVFVFVDSGVEIPLPVDSYSLTLVFPAALQSLDVDGVTQFTGDNKTLPAYQRDILGALHGSAYEDPLRPDLSAPYVALTDFRSACCYEVAAPWQPAQLKYAGYGTWENVPTGAEGFVGPWYAATPDNRTNQWPLDRASGSFRGYVVGAVGPDEVGGGYLDRLRSFSAPIEIEVDGLGQIVSGHIGTIVMPYYTNTTPSTLAFETLPLDPVDLAASSGSSPGTLTGSLASVDRPDPDLDAGSYEARYFGRSGEAGYELAGRLRFRTTNGLIATGSFGTQFVPTTP